MSPELNAMFQEALVAIIMTIISVALPPLTYGLLRYLQALKVQSVAKTEQIRASLPAEALAALEIGARTVTAALEQEAVKQLLNRTGAETKALAMQRLSHFLGDVIGIRGLSEQVLSDAIEAALRAGAHKAYPDWSKTEGINDLPPGTEVQAQTTTITLPKPVEE